MNSFITSSVQSVYQATTNFMKPKATIKTAIALFSGLLVAAPTAAFANRYTDVVYQQLMDAAISLGILSNHQVVDTPYVNTLDDNRSETISITLYSGHSYALLGVCDQDCQDLDLYLYDGYGNLIDSDTSSDDYPIVEVSPSRSGRFYVKTSMARCSESYCYYGVGLFGR